MTEVVLRPVNDQFLREVVFPSFELGVVSAVPAVEHLLRSVNDEHTRIELELLLEGGLDGSFFGLDDPRWVNICYRLVFSEWLKDTEGWALGGDMPGYAGSLDETLHLALMLEDDRYPYHDEQKAKTYRQNVAQSPFAESGLAAMICGRWDPVPGFPPDQVLTPHGSGEYRPQDGIARADWSWRPMQQVNRWASQLPNSLSRLLQREAKRLKPVEAPERHDVLEYWLGRLSDPPTLCVTFSGLGPDASSTWIRELGALARLIREAAAKGHGLTSIISYRAPT